jgi:hypothetical protein
MDVAKCRLKLAEGNTTAAVASLEQAINLQYGAAIYITTWPLRTGKHRAREMRHARCSNMKLSAQPGCLSVSQKNSTEWE